MGRDNRLAIRIVERPQNAVLYDFAARGRMRITPGVRQWMAS